MPLTLENSLKDLKRRLENCKGKASKLMLFKMVLIEVLMY